MNNFDMLFSIHSQTNKKKIAFNDYINKIEAQNTWTSLVNAAINEFTWYGLPSTCSSRFLELNLLFNGQACIVNDEELGFLSLRSAPAGSRWTLYGEPSSIFAYGWNGFNKKYKCYVDGSSNENIKAIVCRDNILYYPYINYCWLAAKRVSDIQRSIDGNVRKLKAPYFISCSEQQKKSVEQIINKIDTNDDIIVSNPSTLPDSFKVLNTGMDASIISSLYNYKTNELNTAKINLGIDAAVNLDKRSRLLTDEVNSDKNISGITLLSRLRERQIFCDKLKEIWNLDVSVEINPLYIGGELESVGGELTDVMEILQTTRDTNTPDIMGVSE